MKEHNLEAFYKYYSNATKEQAIEDMFLDCCEQAKEIERLTVESTEWESKCYKYQDIIKEVREYIENNTQWYDKELGLVVMKGYQTNRIPVIYLYGLLNILDKGE